MLSFVCSMSAEPKSSGDRVCAAKRHRRSAGLSGEEQNNGLISPARGVRKSPNGQSLFLLMDPLFQIITFVCFVISGRLVLRVLRFSAASSDAVTVFLRWQTTLAALNL